jgi:hypothetical protein
MKQVIINVTEAVEPNSYVLITGVGDRIFIPKNSCQPIEEGIRLTEEQAIKLLKSITFLEGIGYNATLNTWRKNNWITEEKKTAQQELEEKILKFKEDWKSLNTMQEDADNIFKLARAAIKEAEDKLIKSTIS